MADAETNVVYVESWNDPDWARRDDPGLPQMAIKIHSGRFGELASRGQAIRTDRRTEWGNPYRLAMGAGAAARRHVIEQYRADLAERVRSGRMPLKRLARLHGKYLGCHCSPQPCHVAVLAAAATWAYQRLEAETVAAQAPSAWARG